MIKNGVLLSKEDENMSFVDAVKNVLTNYVKFEGRARRSEYWYFFLFNLAVSVVLAIIVNVTGIRILSTLWSLAMLLPGLGVCVRRLHDIGKRWPWILVAFIPVAGAIWLIVMLATNGQEGENAFGPDPKAAA